MRTRFQKELAFRISLGYQRAMELLSEELSADPIPELRVSFAPEVVDEPSRE